MAQDPSAQALVDVVVDEEQAVDLDQSSETDELDSAVLTEPLMEADEAGKLRVLFVASECAPYAKTGGLGDVVAALPKALRRLGHDVRIILPLYGSIDRARFGIIPEGTSCVHMGGGEENWIGVHSGVLDREVPVWFVDYERFFGRPGIYDYAGKEYPDNAFRFALLSKAALQICKDRQFIPDIAHAHDWPTALVPVFLNTWDRVLSPLSSTATVLTIHNIGYQGIFHRSAYPYIGVGGEYFTPDVFEYYGQLNLLKAGIHFADALTTVSPTHAREILEPAGGMGLSYYLQRRSGALFGILNGVDYEHWNPATDKLIPARYTPDDLSGKAVCKAALQERFGLEQRAELPVFGIVSRFAPQKGFNLLREALPNALRDMLMQVVVLGTGDAETEGFFHWLTSANPGRVGSYIGFSNELSHLVEAGSDFFLMPSLYEPCGLNQSYSMKYATLPVVRATGGLDDTVRNYDEATGAGTGFKFWDATERALYYTIGWAVSTWFDRPQHIRQLRQQAMSQDFSWNDSAAKYVEVYEHALRHKRAAKA
ncbi:MAG TPA: glycogen synthase GlgA [Pyrinomonadaceae bacterium]|jgi:starch synthase